MSKLGKDPNELLIKGRADEITARYLPKKGFGETAAEDKPEAEEQPSPKKPAAKAPAQRARTAAKKDAVKDGAAHAAPAVQVNLRVPAALAERIDDLVYMKKKSGQKTSRNEWITLAIEAALKREGA